MFSDFVIEFLRSLNKLRIDDGVGGIGRNAYNRTLAPFHPWAYKNIARIALTTLGKKGQLIANVSHTPTNTFGRKLKKKIKRVFYFLKYL